MTKLEELGREVDTSWGEQATEKGDEEDTIDTKGGEERKNAPRDVLKKLQRAEQENKDLHQQISVLRHRIKILETQRTCQVVRKKFEKNKKKASQNQFGEYFRWGWVIYSHIKKMCW